MARYFLKELHIEGFRGIKNVSNPLKLKFAQTKVTSIFAENGTGKSSVFQALEYALSGDISFLRPMQAAEKPQQHILNFFHPEKKATLKLILVPDDGGKNVTITVELDSNLKRHVYGSDHIGDPEQFLKELYSEFVFLDSRKFIKFIEDTALERGRSFGPLLGLGSYGDLHRALKDASRPGNRRKDFELDKLENEIRTLKANIRTSQERIDEICATSFPLSGPSPETQKHIIEALAQEPTLEEHLTCEHLQDVDFSKLEEAIAQSEEWVDKEAFEHLKTRHDLLESTLPIFDSVISDSETSKALIQEHMIIAAQSHDHMRLTILQTAEKFLEESSGWDSYQCPLCMKVLEAPIDEHVRHDLEKLTPLIKSHKELQQQVYESSFLELLETNVDGLAPRGMKACSHRIREAITKYSFNEALLKESLDLLLDYRDNITFRKRILKEQMERLEKSRPVSSAQLMAKVRDAQDIKNILHAKEAAMEKMEQLQKKLKIFARWGTFIERASEKFSAAESEMSNRKLSRISNNFETMYQTIMFDGEGIQPSLNRKAGSEHLELSLKNYHGKKDLSVRATLSESYRNNMAISLFLTAALDARLPARFIVLDDVTSSFDSGHQLKLMSYILQHLQYGANSEGAQFIILSHDGNLKKTFNVLQQESASYSSQWDSQVLKELTPKEIIGTQNLSLHTLKSKAEALVEGPSPSDSAPFIRQYYESVLLQVIRKLRIPVPFVLGESTDRNTIHDLLDAIDRAIKLYEKGQILAIDKSAFSRARINCSAMILNQESHFSTAEFSSLTRNTYKNIIKDIDELLGCFQYIDEAGKTQFFDSLCCPTITSKNKVCEHFTLR